MKDKKAIKRDILNKFRSINAESDETLPPGWLEEVYVRSLTSEEKKLFRKAVQDLISLGIVRNVEGPALNLSLSEKGEKLIYSSELEKADRESSRQTSVFQFTGTEV